MSEVAIRSDGLSKSYRIGERQRYKALRDTLSDAARWPFTRMAHAIRGETPAQVVEGREGANGLLWALKDVSFEVRQGEAVGLIGPNGAGKSTLLKILSRITEPTEGSALLRGRVGSLLEVGTGFHPELTGGENIYLNGAILGMTRGEIAHKFDDIVAFSGVDQFIDTPVRYYSSGMHVRLAFAVAAHMEPEIFLVDEVLAVGDAEFQERCLGKMDEVMRSGRTVLFVSHNMSAIQALCTRGIVIREGKIAFDGPAEGAVKDYLAQLASNPERAFDDGSDREGNGWIRLTGARTLDETDAPSDHLIAGRSASIELTYSNPSGLKHVDVVLRISSDVGSPVTVCSTRLTNETARGLGSAGNFTCRIAKLPFPVGRYRVQAVLRQGPLVLDRVPQALTFEVGGSTFFPSGRTPTPSNCACMVDHGWEHQASD